MPTEIKPVDTSIKGGAPRTMGHAEIAGGHVEVIRESKYQNGLPRHGTDPKNVHSTARTQRYRDGEQHRASLRDSRK